MKYVGKNTAPITAGTPVRFVDGPFATLENPVGVLERHVTEPRDLTYPYEVRVPHPADSEPDATMLIPCARWEFAEI